MSFEVARDLDALLEPPAELVCPITHSVFLDPVLTAAGHVYERAAIERHFERSDSDPMSNQRLVNKSLTPVYVLKARALEYRESTARACVERACDGRCRDPVPLLRRAVELVADAGLSVHGLTAETVAYVSTHPSNALCLQAFAQGLVRSGYRDRAAAIFFSLLLSDPDRSHQADLLRCCLACWAPPSASDDSPGRAAASVAELLASGASCGAEASCAGGSSDGHAMEKLVCLFGSGQTVLSWGQIIDLTEEAGLGVEFAARLCEQLLFGPSRGLYERAGDDDEASAASSCLGGWRAEKVVLCKYVQVLTTSLKAQQSETERRVQELERWRRRASQGGGGWAVAAAAVSVAGAAAARRRLDHSSGCVTHSC
eukprot:scaffold17.g424.t1